MFVRLAGCEIITGRASTKVKSAPQMLPQAVVSQVESAVVSLRFVVKYLSFETVIVKFEEDRSCGSA